MDSQDDKTLFWAGMAVFVIGLAVNVFLIITVGKRKQIQLRLKAMFLNVIAGNLGVLCVFLLLTPPLLLSTNLEATQMTYYAMQGLLGFFRAGTANGAVLLAADRVSAVFWPVSYRVSSNSKRTTAALLVVGWALASLVAAFNFFIKGNGRFMVQAGFVFLCAISVMCMSAAIACRLRQRLVVISPNLTRHPSIHSSPNRQLYHRATVDAVVMMAWFWFSYIPMAVSLLVNPEFVDELTPGRAPKVADLVVLFLVLNSVVGPFLYVWRLLDLKKNLDRCLEKMTRGRNVDTTATTTSAVTTVGVETLSAPEPLVLQEISTSF